MRVHRPFANACPTTAESDTETAKFRADLAARDLDQFDQQQSDGERYPERPPV